MALSPPWEDSGEAAGATPGRRFTPENKWAGTLILDFPAPKTVRNQCVLFQPLFYGTLLQQPGQTNTD